MHFTFHSFIYYHLVKENQEKQIKTRTEANEAGSGRDTDGSEDGIASWLTAWECKEWTRSLMGQNEEGRMWLYGNWLTSFGCSS